MARLAELVRIRIHIPLDGVTEQMRKQKKALLGSYRVIDVNLRAIQVARKGIGNVPRDHADFIGALDVGLHSLAVVGEGYHANWPKRFHCSRLPVWNEFVRFFVVVE